MSELSELEKRVPAELGEFWRENFTALTSAVAEAAGTTTELNSVKAAFESLVADLVLVGVTGADASQLDRLSKSESLAILADLASHLRFNSEGNHWTGGEEPWPELVATETGLEKAREILAERGERWWLRSDAR
jgi:hypothetical protein